MFIPSLSFCTSACACAPCLPVFERLMYKAGIRFHPFQSLHRRFLLKALYLLQRDVLKLTPAFSFFVVGIIQILRVNLFQGFNVAQILLPVGVAFQRNKVFYWYKKKWVCLVCLRCQSSLKWNGEIDEDMYCDKLINGALKWAGHDILFKNQDLAYWRVSQFGQRNERHFF